MNHIRFETVDDAFDSTDFHFVHTGFAERDRIALDPVSVRVPGSGHFYFSPQQDEAELTLMFRYIGDRFHRDADAFSQRLYNRRRPVRIILPEEDDRYYPGQVIHLSTQAQHPKMGILKAQVRLYRPFAWRRWRDHEINMDNPWIHFSQSVVPVRTEYRLTGSVISIPYYNEGVDLPPTFEVEGADYPRFMLEGQDVRYDRRVEGVLTLGLEGMTAREDGASRDAFLVGDPLVIPHGQHDIRVHYQLKSDSAYTVVHQGTADWQGGSFINTRVATDGETGEGIGTIPVNTPEFSRSSPGYHEDGTPASGPRYDPGKTGCAVRMEKEVTQELSDAGFQDLDTYWNRSGVKPTDSVRGAARILRASSGDGTDRVYLYQTVPVSEQEEITIQVNLRKAGGVDHCVLRLSFYDAEGRLLTPFYRNVADELTEDFRTVSLTDTAPAGSVSVRAFLIDDGGTRRNELEVEAVQPMLTKTAHTWGWHLEGTKAAETLSIPGGSMLNEEAGSIGVWVYKDGTGRAGFIWDTAGSNRFLFYRYAGDQTYNLWMNGANVFDGKGTPAPGIGWHYWEVRWVNGRVEWYLDGEIVSLQDESGEARTELIPDFSGVETFFIGSDNRGGRQWNHLIDDFRISNRDRNPEERYDPASGDPIPNDEKTSLLFDFDRRFRGESGGLFISENIGIHLERNVSEGRMAFKQTPYGSVDLETRWDFGRGYGSWEPVGADGRISAIRSDTDLSHARMQYCIRFHTFDVSRPHRLQRVTIDFPCRKEGRLRIQNRKRLL
ncbi:LamG domain-containing protein [Paludifilum halophilum]|uniref:Uncharacterized protein n=1 Tax=Paludifilum halophilum TaxID=1642702 RepID=A0A235BBL0_9BACL|nr:LamG domain-containing protein [Paludifilum halophilum]OYD08955.1 hypothetical protein CHM34_04045 [Paludifilum halophilum]